MTSAEFLNISEQEGLVEILTESVRLVFEITFGMEVKLDQAKTEAAPIATGDLSGVIGLVQNYQEGNLIISFPFSTLSSALKKIYGRSFETIDQSMIESAGEITNMVYGQFKKNMNDRGHNLQMALPSIITSDRHQILQGTGSTGYHLIFSLNENMSFTTTISFTEKNR